MRIVGSVSLAIAATFIGLFGTFMLGVAGLSVAGPGLSWAGPGVTVIEYSDSDDSERAIGIAMGGIALVVWLGLLLSAVWVACTEAAPHAHGVPRYGSSSDSARCSCWGR